MTTFGTIYLAVLLSASAACILWWMQKFLGADVVRIILTVVVVTAWLVVGYFTPMTMVIH